MPGVSPRSWRAPTNSSGSFRSWTRSSASGNARRTSGSASSAPSSRMWRYSPARSSCVHAAPRSSSSAHCTSSRTSTSPEPGAISTVQQRIGACSLIRSSPVIRPTRSVPEPGAEAAVRLLREHAERPGVDASPLLGEELERVVGLARVRRPEMRDDRLRRRTPLGQPDLDPVLGTPDRGALVRAGRAGVAGGAARACAAGVDGSGGLGPSRNRSRSPSRLRRGRSRVARREPAVQCRARP